VHPGGYARLEGQQRPHLAPPLLALPGGHLRVWLCETRGREAWRHLLVTLVCQLVGAL
jgi:hypothetical protein